MGDKRFTDNKVIKNPLLSNVDQNSILEELVQNPLLVPAAPPKLSQSTVDGAKGNQDKNEEKHFLTGNTQPLSNLATETTRNISSSSGIVARPCENSFQLSHPELISTKQTFSEPSSILKEIPLERSQISPPSTACTQSVLPNFSGPPPSTTYNRPANKLPSSRYRTSSFLQTIPSAQYFPSQSNPNTPSISPTVSLQNFQKSSSSPVTFFVPQHPTQSSSLNNIPNTSPASSITSETSQILNTSTLTDSNNYKTFSSQQSNISTIPSKISEIHQKQFTDSQSHEVNDFQSHRNHSTCNPANISTPPVTQCSVLNPIPSLPVSQPIIVSSSPALISSISNTSLQSESVPAKTSETFFSAESFKNILLDKESFSSFCQPTSDSSSVLRSRSPTPQPATIPQYSGSTNSVIATPSILQPSVSLSNISPEYVTQVNTVVTTSSEVITQSSLPGVSSNIFLPLASNNIVSATIITSASTLTPSAPSHLDSVKPNIIESSSSSNLTQTEFFSQLIPPNSSQRSSILFTTINSSSPTATGNVDTALIPISTTLSSSTPVQQTSHYSTSPVEFPSFGTPVVPTVSTILQPDPPCGAVSTTKYFQPIADHVLTEANTESLETQPLSSNTVTSSSVKNGNYSSTSNFFSADNSFPVHQTFPSNSSSDELPDSTFENIFSKTLNSRNSNLNNKASTRNIQSEATEISETTCTLQNTDESKINPSVNIQPHVPETSTSTSQASLAQSSSHPPLFTFSPSGSLNDLGSRSQPPKQPFVQSTPISVSKHFQHSTKSSGTCSDLFVNSNIQENIHSVSSEGTPSTVPTLLDPSKFFSISPPPLSDQSIDKTSTSSAPLPQQGANQQSSPATLPTLQTSTQLPPPLPPTTVTKPTAFQNNFPRNLSPSSTPPTLASHTPPPPYSSLFNKTEPLTNGKVLAPVSSLAPPNESTNNPQAVGIIREEELDQIPLDGNTIPLYNPHNIGSLSQTTAKVGGNSNTYRLGSGLKRPSYAPVPDLGITHQVQQLVPPMSGPPPLQAVTMTSGTAVSSPSTTRSSSVASSPPSEPTTFNYNVMAQGQVYRPAYHHWFYKKGGESKSIWQPFSMADSLNLEQVFTSPELNENTKVATDGGRYDVKIMHRRKIPVYWEEPTGEVRRCSWFVRAPIESRYIPYDENIAEILEDAYKTGCIKNEWNRRVELADGEVIILHSPNAIAHHQRSSSPDAWGNAPTMQQKPRIVKRGLEDFEISEGEPNQVDHLLLMVHGIGKVCDLRFRSLVQVVDDFRNVSLQLIQSHFRSGTENGNVGRVEVLPVEWHRALHTEIIDKRLADITLPSIPKAREFTNDVLLDILFYTSPVFCERIVQAVGAEINRVYNLYMSRNPGFRGGISLGGHSLGSLILFDMLCHQKPHRSIKSAFAPQSSIHEGDEDMPEVGCLKAKARLSRRMSYLTIGSAGTGQPYIIYPQLQFQPRAFFALGSPIGMFLTVRGIEGLGEEFKFPTCPKFFNIFHPNDPVAYRIEALVSPQMIGVPAVVIPHHKGRKRMHLELKDTMAHVTTALKQKLIDSMRSTWNTVYQLALFHRPDSSLQQEVDKVIESEILTSNECTNESASANHLILTEDEALDLKVGNLNGGDRIDYVLQEAPLETFNQYISAVRSHVVYWESEDTMLLILKELYATMGISPDCQVPQPILPFDISSDSNKETYSEYTDSIGAPPTQFIRK